ncbi:DUF2891 family protein [Candidatus Nephthysia bennettiae]|uniref:DUF2891 family protein n=1 Tax=Candidatus Nephthysia bennettiae TaxID=3127016 RepID=A0A934N1I0_9BACT|nr:DUF2891 family protein [Candidatus Dormibacteraeota bacterium]MBJ7613640.1 DUF2891 family protein [Candidatus Dormibacteraeota bacterium]
MSWQGFLASREELLRSLSLPILSAVVRKDTSSPIFHGCYDWHSAVHGLYSLYAIYQRTGDDLYLEAAQQVALQELVADELRHMASVVGDSENPYGFAWMLALAIRQKQATGECGLCPLAEYAANRIVQLVEELNDETAFTLATVDKHPNLSFGLIHLALWARHMGAPDLHEVAARAVRRWLLDPRLDRALPVAADTTDVSEFMPPRLMRLAAIACVLGSDETSYLQRHMPARFTVAPLTTPTTVHAAGVNFFRAFALLHLYRATGLPRLRENVARLVLYQVKRPDLWRTADYDHRHWIAQIGVRVIDDSYEAE